MLKNLERILSYLILHGSGTIPGIAAEMGISIGTATKLVTDLLEAGLVKDGGVMETASGRKPHRFEPNPNAGFYLGVNIGDHYLSFGLMDYAGKMVAIRKDIPFDLTDTPHALEKMLAETDLALQGWSDYRSRIRAVGVNIPGRVNRRTGRSYTFFSFTDEPLAAMLQQRLGLPVSLNNDTHAMTWAEFVQQGAATLQNMIYLNVNWGFGAGIVIDGKLYTGKSGFAGEFGHVFGYDNNILCRCGKRGCMETEISGQALQRQLIDRIRNGEASILSQRVLSSDIPLTLSEILDAVRKEDVLCIDVIEDIGRKLGVQTAGLMNLFNPELVIIGGEIAKAGDYFLQPLKTAVNKHCFNVVNQDTEVRLSTLNEEGALLGACLLARTQL